MHDEPALALNAVHGSAGSGLPLHTNVVVVPDVVVVVADVVVVVVFSSHTSITPQPIREPSAAECTTTAWFALYASL